MISDARVSKLLCGAAALTLFGIALPGATNAQDDFRRPNQPVGKQFNFLAKSLQAHYFSREVGNTLDQIQFLPHGSHNPTHLIACIETNLEVLAPENAAEPLEFGVKLQPSVQVIDLKTRAVRTVVRGMNICDGIRTTAWGTVLATEEDFTTDIGAVFEILNPLDGNEYTVLDRGDENTPATIVDQNGVDARDRIRKWRSPPVIRWEGIYVHPTGVLIAGDEERPGSYDGDPNDDREGDTDGGAIYKFIPTVPYVLGTGAIASLEQSPLASGTSYALQVSCLGDAQQFGQGCEIGAAAWIKLDPAKRADDGIFRIGREAAFMQGATGYYRPEDLHDDPMYSDPEHPNAVRLCFAATGNAAASNYGEVHCMVDSDVTQALTDATGAPQTGQVVINRFLEGGPDLNQPDNLAFQPRTGNLYVIEDNPNGDVWACLPDGDDRDIKTDGCVRVLTLADPTSEPTGLIFDPSGRRAFFNIQHSADGNMPLVDDYPTDDLILLTGLKVRHVGNNRDFGRFVERVLDKRSQELFGLRGE